MLEYYTIVKIRTVLLFYDGYFLFNPVKYYWSVKSNIYIVQHLQYLQYKHQNLCKKQNKQTSLLKRLVLRWRLVLCCSKNMFINWKTGINLNGSLQWKFVNRGTDVKSFYFKY
jgi:hypothetical protein